MKKPLVYVLVICLILALSVPFGIAELRCDDFVGSCTGECTTQGDCASGTYSGDQVGCDNGDSQINTSQYHSDAEDYLESDLDYTHSWRNTAYLPRDFTYSINGQCRYQAIISVDNHYVSFKDGPEPNCQPWFCDNGNPDLPWPWHWCVVDSVANWHYGCN